MGERMLLPRLGETMETGKVAAWLVKPGARFRRGETIVEIESDKTVVELPALQNGVLMEIIAEAGSEVAVGEPLCLIDVEGDGDGAGAAAPPATMDAPQRADTQVPVLEVSAVRSAPTADATRTGQMRATPKARRLARDGKIDLGSVEGTGRRGRIEARDLPTRIGAVTADDVRMASTPAGQLAWRSWGDASAARRFVLIHGFAGDSKAWSNLAAMLARLGFYVLAPDLPSHGLTQIEADSLPALVQPIIAWMDATAASPVHLIGHSLGAAVAAGVAAAAPHHVAELTLIAPVGFGVDIDRHFIEGMSHASGPGAITHLLQRLALNIPPMSAALRDAIFDAVAGRLIPLADAIAVEGRQQLDVVSVLADLAMPVRVVWGCEDRILPCSHAGQTPPMIPVHFVQGAGHMIHWDQPKVLADLLTKANKSTGGLQ